MSSATRASGVPLAAAAAELLRQPLLERAMVEVAGERVLERFDQVVGEGVEGAREVADLVLALPAQARAVVAAADGVGDGADPIERADDEAPEQQRDDQAEQRRRRRGP